jgi:hypothetical protein
MLFLRLPALFMARDKAAYNLWALSADPNINLKTIRVEWAEQFFFIIFKKIA